MKNILFLLAILPHLLFAEEEQQKKIIQVYRTSTEIDQNLKKDEAVFEFQFHARYGSIDDAEMMYSIDGRESKQILKNRTLTVQTDPGKHIFQFYLNYTYYEVYTDSLEIKARHRDQYSITLYHAEVIEEAEKPVIYLYPEETTDVTVKMDIHGENTFLYPTYNDAWNFTAQPNGDLEFGENTYNYLFWEATIRTVLSPKQTASGFFVDGKNAVSFLEEILTTAGLNSKEQADFITYWGPRLAVNELNFVHFEFNDECNKYADLDISPKPDNIYRIFMVWGAVSEQFDTELQAIETMDRSGFSVLEWGGKQSKIRGGTRME